MNGADFLNWKIGPVFFHLSYTVFVTRHTF